MFSPDSFYIRERSLELIELPCDKKNEKKDLQLRVYC
jgi:hypothetical protein